MTYDAAVPRGRKKEPDRTKIRTEVIPVIRATTEELTALTEGAEEDGEKLSTWLRELGLKRRKTQLRKK